MEHAFFYVGDIAKCLTISDSKAYEIIRNLNSELKAKGYLTQRGRVPRKYFEERYHIREGES